LGERYMFNLQSRHHLKKLFFDTLGECPLNRTPTGQPQADEEFFDSVATKYDWVPKLIIYNKLNKIKSTYYESFIENSEDGIWYAQFKQHGTTSGRFSGNSQQLPRVLEGSDIVAKYSNKIREFIIARPGYTLMSADWESLEPHIFAHVSNDAAIQNIFNTGKDFYSEIAIMVEGLQNVSADKKADNYLGKLNKTARQKAKAYSLGIAYGLTAYKLKFDLDIPEAEAVELVAGYYKAFPNLRNKMIETANQAKKMGYVINAGGRKRRLPDAQRLFSKYGSPIEDDLALWKEYGKLDSYAQAKKDRKIFKNEMNNAFNFLIQGLAATLLNRASMSINKKLAEQKLDAHIINMCHDEIIMEISNNNVDTVNALVKCEMENVMQLAVKLKVEPQTGENYAKCK